MQVSEVVKNIFVFEFPDRRATAMSFLRMTEYAESPEWKGRFFTVDQYREWYCGQSPTGKFTYADDWSGFNVPGRIIPEWADIFNVDGGLSRLEVITLASMYDLQADRHCDFADLYFIGLTKGYAPETLRHEIAHGLYYGNARYRKGVDQIVADRWERLFDAVQDDSWGTGYHGDVHRDEAQAYAATGSHTSTDPEVDSMVVALRKNFNQFYRG